MASFSRERAWKINKYAPAISIKMNIHTHAAVSFFYMPFAIAVIARERDLAEFATVFSPMGAFFGLAYPMPIFLLPGTAHQSFLNVATQI
jgi:hypothetical protein